MKLFKKCSAINLLAVSTLLLASTGHAQEADTAVGANCTYNTTTPIIPDGNIATQDELISAQKRIKAYQENLLDFRECLLEAEKTLDPESETFAATKAALTARSDQSIDLEQKVASEFNGAIQIYKAR